MLLNLVPFSNNSLTWWHSSLTRTHLQGDDSAPVSWTGTRHSVPPGACRPARRSLWEEACDTTGVAAAAGEGALWCRTSAMLAALTAETGDKGPPHPPRGPQLLPCAALWFCYCADPPKRNPSHPDYGLSKAVLNIKGVCCLEIFVGFCVLF